MEFVTNVV